MATYQRGVTSGSGTSYGLIQDFSITYEGDMGEARDANGNVIAIEDYNPTVKVSLSYILDTAQTIPVKGDSITIAGEGEGKFHIDSVVVTENNADWKKLSITATRWIENGIPL